MITEEAIKALQESASIKSANDALSNSYAIAEVCALPSDYRVQDLEAFGNLRRRARGTMKSESLASFCRYYEACDPSSSAPVFIDTQKMCAVAVLNFGTEQAPGHADNCADLQLGKTAAYQVLLQMVNQPKKQSDIAEFFEDWPAELRFFHDGKKLKPGKAIASIRKLTIESMRKIESTEQQLGAARSAFESVQATAVELIPTHIYFSCKPYESLTERLFVMRLTIQTTGEKPAIVLRLQNFELHKEEMGREFADVISGEIKDAPVYLGVYERKT